MIKDDVREMTDSFTKMSGDMLDLRKYVSDLSESVGRQMKELKEMMSSLINSSTRPSIGSSKSKKGKSSGTEHRSSSDEIGSRKHIHASKSWDSMCESDDDNQRDQLLTMIIVKCQSSRGLACINESTRAFGWGIRGPYPLTSSAVKLAKCPDQPPLLTDAWVSLS
jgi:hypothetical protein